MELSAVSATVVVAVITSGILVRGWNLKRRNRTGVVMYELSVHIIPNLVRLRRLRCSEVRHNKLLILLSNIGILRGQFLRSQALIDAAEAAVHRVDDVASAVLHGVSGVASLRSHVIPHLRNGCAVFAAALLRLHRHVVELLHQGCLLVAAGKLRITEPRK